MPTSEYINRAQIIERGADPGLYVFGHIPKRILVNVLDEESGDVRVVQIDNLKYLLVVDVGDLEKEFGLGD